jgi:hypothetical protein
MVLKKRFLFDCKIKLVMSMKMAHGKRIGKNARLHRIKGESGMNRIMVAVLLSAT